eukprot:1333353-Amphidinium_carterae.1
MFIALQSLKSAFMKVVVCMSDWLLERLRPQPDHLLPDTEVIGSVGFAGCESTEGRATLVDWISHDCSSLSSTLLDLWRFQPWTSSRWATMGPAAWAFCISSLLGFMDLFVYMHEQGQVTETVTEFIMSGVQKLDMQSRDICW